MPSRRDVLAGLATAGAAATAGCLGFGDDSFSPGTDANSDWPMPRFNPGNDAFAPDAVAPREGVTERWSALDGFDVFAPAVVDGTVYAADTYNGLVALDGASGEEVWRFAPGERPLFSQPAVHDGTVYVGGGDNEQALYAVDAASGEERWSVAGVSSHDGPIIVLADDNWDTALFTGNRNGEVFRFDTEGEVTWQDDHFGRITALAAHFRTLYVGTASGEVYTYQTAGTHEAPPDELWRTEVGPQIESLTPTSNGLVVTSFGGPLTNVGRHGDATDPVWTVEWEHAGSPPVHAGSWLYSVGGESVSAIREYDKNLHWREGGSFGFTAPVAAGDTLYVPGEGAVHAYDLDGGVGGGRFSFGTKRWSHQLPDHGVQALAVGDGALFVACEPGGEGASALYCLEEA